MGVEVNLEPGRAAVEPPTADRVVTEPLVAEPLAEAEEQLLSRISLEAEVPEVLFDGMREFIRSHPQWDQYRLITAALASFLFQNGSRDACVAQHYLNGLVLR